MIQNCSHQSSHQGTLSILIVSSPPNTTRVCFPLYKSRLHHQRLNLIKLSNHMINPLIIYIGSIAYFYICRGIKVNLCYLSPGLPITIDSDALPHGGIQAVAAHVAGVQ